MAKLYLKNNNQNAVSNETAFFHLKIIIKLELNVKFNLSHEYSWLAQTSAVD